MDLNKYSSYLSLPPSNLYRAERLVESVIKYHLNHEDMVDEIVENLTGETLEYALKLFVEKTGADLNEALEYMGVKVAFNGTTYSAPTVGLYGIKSKPEIKSKIKTKVLARNEKENKSKNEAYTVTNADKKGNTPAYQGYKAGKKNVKTGKPLYKAAGHLKLDKAHYDWKEDLHWEAMKRDKLDIKETGVKNKIEINPTVKTEAAKAPVKK